MKQSDQEKCMQGISIDFRLKGRLLLDVWPELVSVIMTLFSNRTLGVLTDMVI
jgi:hypothetical protein